MATAVLSAFFVNDTVCLVLAPLVAEITFALRRNPMPYLLALAMASNIGSVATLTGNPQNMLIGSFSGIPNNVFARALAPVAALSLVVCILILALLYRQEFRRGSVVEVSRREIALDRALLWKSLAVSAGMVLFFFLGWPIAEVAIVAGALLLLLTRSVHPEEIYAQVDWSLLVMFCGIIYRGGGRGEKLDRARFGGDGLALASR